MQLIQIVKERMIRRTYLVIFFAFFSAIASICEASPILPSDYVIKLENRAFAKKTLRSRYQFFIDGVRARTKFSKSVALVTVPKDKYEDQLGTDTEVGLILEVRQTAAPTAKKPPGRNEGGLVKTNTLLTQRFVVEPTTAQLLREYRPKLVGRAGEPLAIAPFDLGSSSSGAVEVKLNDKVIPANINGNKVQVAIPAGVAPGRYDLAIWRNNKGVKLLIHSMPLQVIPSSDTYFLRSPGEDDRLGFIAVYPNGRKAIMTNHVGNNPNGIDSQVDTVSTLSLPSELGTVSVDLAPTGAITRIEGVDGTSLTRRYGNKNEIVRLSMPASGVEIDIPVARQAAFHESIIDKRERLLEAKARQAFISFLRPPSISLRMPLTADGRKCTVDGARSVVEFFDIDTVVNEEPHSFAPLRQTGEGLYETAFPAYSYTTEDFENFQNLSGLCWRRWAANIQFCNNYLVDESIAALCGASTFLLTNSPALANPALGAATLAKAKIAAAAAALACRALASGSRDAFCSEVSKLDSPEKVCEHMGLPYYSPPQNVQFRVKAQVREALNNPFRSNWQNVKLTEGKTSYVDLPFDISPEEVSPTNICGDVFLFETKWQNPQWWDMGIDMDRFNHGYTAEGGRVEILANGRLTNAPASPLFGGNGTVFNTIPRTISYYEPQKGSLEIYHDTTNLPGRLSVFEVYSSVTPAGNAQQKLQRGSITAPVSFRVLFGGQEIDSVSGINALTYNADGSYYVPRPIVSNGADAPSKHYYHTGFVSALMGQR